MTEDVIWTVDAYLNALAAKDLSTAPLHPDVTFESPLSPPIQGLDAVRQVFAGFFPAMKGIKVSRHIADSEWCATLFQMETPFGTVPMVDCSAWWSVGLSPFVCTSIRVQSSRG